MVTTDEKVEAAAVDPSFRFVTCKKVAAANGLTMVDLGALPESMKLALYREAAERIYRSLA